MISELLIAPFARAYAGHAGLAIPEDVLRAGLKRRLASSPGWVRAYMALGAVLARWVFPLAYLRRLRRFENLTRAEREDLLSRLQRESRLPLRAAFLGIKPVVLGLCYGREEFLAGLGYGIAGGQSG